MMKKFSLLVAFALVIKVVIAQSVDDGKKFMYYERYTSAKSVFDKLVAANPANADAAYWLGQSMLQLKDVAGAKAVYQKALQANGSNPLLLVGMGAVELQEGKAADARQRFETAISLTKAKDIEVLNAIGRANTLAKAGDATYAIEKLKIAPTIKGFKNPETDILIGDAYKKNIDGGAAVTAYNDALTIDPKYAAAKCRIGRVYATQGKEQEAVFTKYFNDAVALDPGYAPAYYELYFWYYFRDVNKAKEYFAKYKANTDQTPAIEYEEASLLYASGDFKGAIDKADQLLKGEGNTADARLYRLKGYSYDKLGDSTKALENMDVFFSKATEDQVIPDNLAKEAALLAKFPGRDAQTEEFFNKAIAADTLIQNKVDYATQAVAYYKRAGNQQKTSEWITRTLTLKPNYTKTDLYNAGYEQFKAKNYTAADSLFGVYKQKYPDETYGYYWAARSKWAIDSTMEKGLANDDFMKMVAIAEKDKDKFKNVLITSYGYLAGYAANIKKDRPAAIGYLDKILELDPTNKDAADSKQILQKAGNAPPKKGAGK